MATIEVVVVLPCVPAIAMPYFIRMSSASISARGMTGIFLRCASITSSLSGRMAEETTTTETSSGMLAGPCPDRICAPRLPSRSVMSVSLWSDPVTP
ncbi:MAG: hypothetical protein WBG20_07390 [Candidatus Deferrimicrobiaceae bacterium]